MALRNKKSMKLRLHVGDDVIVIAGKSKGHRGQVIRTSKEGRVMVSGAQIVTTYQA